MSQLTTARVNVRPKMTLLVLVAVLVVCGVQAQAQGRLGDLVEESGFNWIIGKWQATTDQGDKIQVEWKWQLNKNMIAVHLKWPNYEYRGMIFYKVTEEQVVQIGADSTGGNSKGTWDAWENKALLRYEHTGPDWETHRMGIAHSKVDDQTMKVEVYGLDSDGKLTEEPRFTTQYKRVKEKTATTGAANKP
jgi:hypothetical protein